MDNNVWKQKRLARLKGILVVCAAITACLLDGLMTGQILAQPVNRGSAPTITAAQINVSDMANRRKPAGGGNSLPKVSPLLSIYSGSGKISTSVNPERGPLVSASRLRTASPPPNLSFPALGDNGTTIPPDTMGAAGPNHLMVTLNSEVRFQDKSGNALPPTLLLEDFWRPVVNFGGDVFDPKVIYDPYANRWITTACADSQSANSAVLIGVSQTSDPLGSWNLYRVDADTNNTTWADYPGIGFNRHWVVVTMNMFDIAGAGFFNRMHAYVFEKTNMYNGNLVASNTLLSDSSVFTLMPTVTYDEMIDPLYLISNERGNNGAGSGELRLFQITGATGSENLNSVGVIQEPVPWDDTPNVGNANFAPQLGSVERIMNNDARMLNAVYRNGAVWCAQTVFLPVTIGSRSAAQWWEINPNSISVVQRGRVDDATGQRFFAFPSIAVNRNGDALLGYSSFSSSQYASAGYSFRFSGDVPNTMQSEEILKSGEAAYFKDFGSGRNRWGDYSATVVDPLNDLDLWTVQEYAATPFGGADRWGTWWGKVLLSVPPDGILEVVVSPLDKSLLRAGSAQPFFVTVFDTLPVTNALVAATIPGFFTNQVFFNNGLTPDVQTNDNVYSLRVDLPPTNTTLQMILNISATGKTNVVLTNFYTIATPPTNDFFANAFKLPDNGGMVSAFNFFASKEAGEPVHAGVATFGNSLWWNWAPTNSGPVLIDTLGSQFDTIVAVYTNNTITNLMEVVSANDVTNQLGAKIRSQALLFFNAVAGQTYRIAVAGTSTNEAGSLQMRIEFNGQPDTVAPVVTITNLASGFFVATNFAQQVAFSNPQSGLILTNPVYVLSGTAADPIPNNSGVIQVQITANDGIPQILRFTNSIANTVSWSITNSFSPGSNLLQVVALDLAQNRSVPNTLNLTFRSFDPVNDVFANALEMTNLSGAILTNNLNATFEQGEPNHVGKIGGKSVWYFFRAPQDGILSLSTTNSTFDTIMAVYTGNRVDQLTPLNANDDAGVNIVHSEITQTVQSNRVYHVAIDGLAGAAGQVVLQYVFTPGTIFDLSVSNTLGGVVFPQGGQFPSNTVVNLFAVPDVGSGFASWVGDVLSLRTNIAITMRSNTAVTAVFLPLVATDNYESGGFRTNIGYSFSGNSNWFVQLTNAQATNVFLGGRYFARSGKISNSQSSTLTLTTPTRAGGASFDYRVSSERDFDKFTFWINGVPAFTNSGESGWIRYNFAVTASPNTVLQWVYSKDPADFDHLDAVFIDNLKLPLFEPADPTVRAVFSPRINRTGTSDFSLRLESGQTNQIYFLQESPDLFNWRTIFTNLAPFGFVEFTDTNAVSTNLSRFYRAMVP